MRITPFGVIAVIALIVSVVVGLKIKNDGDTRQATELQRIRNAELQQNDMTDGQYPSAAPTTSATIPDAGGDLQPMTGEECAAAGAEAGWSSTWGPASDGCWIISPDGSDVRHIGTWKGE